MGSRGQHGRWWPSSPSQFIDTHICPACFAPLRGYVCPACGLDVSAPESRELFAASRRVVDAEEQRQQILATMRDNQARRHAQPYSPPPPALTSPQPPTADPAAQWPPAHPTAQPQVGRSSGPRRSGIQILLLAVGVILVSVAAIFFLVVAYLIATLELRSALTALVGVAVVIATGLLRRRGLVATSEGVAVVAVVFLVLDVWLVRANGLFGADSLPPWSYTALSLTIVSIVLIASRLLAQVRSYAIAGIVLASLAVFSAGVALFPNAGPGSRAWVGALLVSTVGLAWPLMSHHRAERATTRALAAGGAMFSLLFAAASWPSFTWGTSVSFVVTAGVLAAHLWYSPVATARAPSPLIGLTGTPQPPTVSAPPLSTAGRLGAWKTAAGAGVGLAMAGAATAPAVHLDGVAVQLAIPSLLTAAAAIVLAAVANLTARTASGAGLRIASDVALAVCALVAIPALGIGIVESVAGIAVPNFTLPPVDAAPAVFPQLGYAPAITLAALACAVVASLALRRQLRRFGWLPLGIGGLAVAAFGIACPLPLGSVAVLGLLAVTATVLFVVLRPRRGRRVALGLLIVGPALLCFFLGANSAGSWPFAAILALGCLISFRLSIPARVKLVDRLAIAPIVTGLLVALSLLTARWVPLWIAALIGESAETIGPLPMVLVAAAIVAAASLLGTRLSSADTSTAAALAGMAAVLGIVELTAERTTSPLPYLVSLGAVLLAQLAWQLPRVAADRPARYITAALIPPTSVLLAVECWRVLGAAAWGAPELLAAAIAVVLAGSGIFLFRHGRLGADGTPRSHSARLGWDAAIALTSVVTVPAALTTSDFGPLNLLLLGVIPLLFSAGEGDIVRGSSPRRHLAWVSLPWLVAALWLLLGQEGVGVLEAYTLPVAGLLALVLALIIWRQPIAASEVPSGRNMLVVAAIVVGALPSIARAPSGEPWRAVALVGIGCVLALCAPALPAVWRGVRFSLWLWCAGLLMAAISGCARAFRIISEGAPSTFPLELWLGAVALALTGGGVLWQRRARSPRVFAQIAVASAPAVIAIPLANLVVVSPVAPVRVALVALAVMAYFVAASWVQPPERAVAVRWTAGTSAAFLCIGAVATGLQPFEAVTVPIAACAIAGGILRLRADRRQRSWRHLGLGVGLLLAPSLLLDLGATELWRIVGLGAVALAVLIWGVAARLQAPTVVAAVVVIIHGLAQLWPWISVAYGAAPWWLWAGVGGVVLIVIAATYEKRINELRTVARSISSLR